MKDRFVFFILLFGLCSLSSAINFYEVNVAWQYDPGSPLKMKHRVVSNSENDWVFLSIASLDSVAGWDIACLIQQNYDSKIHEEVNPLVDTLVNQPYKSLIKIILPKSDRGLLVLRIKKKNLSLYYDVPLRNGKRSFPEFYPSKNEIPILESYLKTGINWNLEDTLYAMSYPEPPEKALPPMAQPASILPNIQSDTAFAFSSDSGVFQDYNFYFISADSLANNGLTFLKVPPYYPKFRKLPELVQALSYLTNETEQKALANSTNLKKSFDSFWINTYGSSSKAKKAIKQYYDKVELANRIFTTYRQGWKTDRGMIFIIFGPPDEVYRQNNLEEWYYDEGIVLEYSIISDFFSPKTYSLRRKQSLQQVWYDRIAYIRSGL